MTGSDTVGKVTPEEIVVSRTNTADILKNLPPLPRPDYWAQCSESLVSIFTVPLIGFVIIAAVYFLVATDVVPEAVQRSCIGVVVLEAFVGILCLLALLLGDPGIIRRGVDTCNKMPDEVVERLARKESQPCHNIIGRDNSCSFCVRCFVWRRKELKPKVSFSERLSRYIPNYGIIEEVYNDAHHCSTCQRCVRDFHHHCGFYGRCIAKGNMLYFKMIMNLGFLGIATLLVVIPITLAFRSGWVASLLSAVGVVVLSVVLTSCAYFCN